MNISCNHAQHQHLSVLPYTSFPYHAHEENVTDSCFLSKCIWYWKFLWINKHKITTTIITKYLPSRIFRETDWTAGDQSWTASLGTKWPKSIIVVKNQSLLHHHIPLGVTYALRHCLITSMAQLLMITLCNYLVEGAAGMRSIALSCYCMIQSVLAWWRWMN